MDVREGCGLEGLASLPDDSVDLLLSDPPSGATRAPGDQVPNLGRFWREAARVCHGRVVVVDPFAGSFSAGVAALQEGRRFIGWDIDASRAPRQLQLGRVGP